jgi:hypothetical protein
MFVGFDLTLIGEEQLTIDYAIHHLSRSRLSAHGASDHGAG